MHFDLDEPHLVGGGGARHPSASAVVYLTDNGSPTLVTSLHVHDQVLSSSSSSSSSLSLSAAAEEEEEGMAGYLCPPAKGRVLLFDGGLLHVRCLLMNMMLSLLLFLSLLLLLPLSSSLPTTSPPTLLPHGVCPIASDGRTDRCSPPALAAATIAT